MPPPVKKSKFSSCDIRQLADNDLTEIFKRLPPYDRLVVSEVCRRWHQISRKLWFDVKTLDLSSVPGKHIGAVIKQCPNLQSVFAVRKSFDSRELLCLTNAHGLSSVKFYGCEFTVSAAEQDRIHDVFQAIFSDQLEHTAWTELTLHDASFRLSPGSAAKWKFSATFLPASLTRVQLSRLSYSLENWHSYHNDVGVNLEGLERLGRLETFIWHTGRKCGGGRMILDLRGGNLIRETYSYGEEYNSYAKLSTLANLKELCIGQAMIFPQELNLSRLSSSLPQLEVLFLNDISCVQDSDVVEGLNELITKHSLLRILVLAGEFDNHADIELGARKRFPLGFGSDPLPLLHIFIGKEASEKIRFAKSTSDAAIIHPINLPMPVFLEREDIAPIVEDVWLAEKIREVAKHGGKLWDYEKYDTASSVQHC